MEITVLKKKAVIYIRVSTQEQKLHGFSIDEQRERLIAYCKAMDWDIVAIRVDGGYSGKDTNRPGLQKLLTEIKSFDIVVVYKLDRLSRSQKDTLSLVEDYFLTNDIGFVSLQEKLDTTTAAGRLMIGILSAFAQLERETFIERSLLGRTGRARTGKWVGTSKPPIGYDYNVEKQELIINAHEAEQVKKVFELYAQGVGLQRIAAIMHAEGYTHKYGDWTWWGGVITMLRNSVYIGKVKFDGQEFEGNHQPIIEQEKFDSVQTMLSERKLNELYKRKSPFSHLLRCANCGAKMFYLHRKSLNREPKYYCYSRYGQPLMKVKDPECKMRIWPAHLVEEHILSRISEIATDKKKATEYFGQKNKPHRANTAELQKKVVELDKQINKLLELYQYDLMPVDELNVRIKALHDEKNSISSMIESINNKVQIGMQAMNTFQQAAKEIRNNWDKLEILTKVELVNVLISRIVISDENIDIVWNSGILADK